MNDLELFTFLILGVVGCGLAFFVYVIGVVVQEAELRDQQRRG